MKEITPKLYDYLKELVVKGENRINLSMLSELKPLMFRNTDNDALFSLEEIEANKQHLKGVIWEREGELLTTEDLF